jgi:hypothetical protein
MSNTNKTYIIVDNIYTEFDEHLNETYDWFTCGGVTEISPAEILKALDRNLYDSLLETYIDKHYGSEIDYENGERLYYTERYDE